jgi:predicted kinase
MIFLMRGTSCSGKDRFISHHFKDHCVLSSDKFRLMFLDSVEDQSKNQFIHEYVQSAVEIRLRFGTSYTVVNATNLKFKDCVVYLELAKKFGKNVTIISIDPPGTDVLIERSVNRGLEGGLRTPDDVIHRHVNSYYSGIERFIEAQSEYTNYKFIRIDQDWEVIE